MANSVDDSKNYIYFQTDKLPSMKQLFVKFRLPIGFLFFGFLCMFLACVNKPSARESLLLNLREQIHEIDGDVALAFYDLSD